MVLIHTWNLIHSKLVMEQSTQQTREHILAQIPAEIKTLLETVGSEAIRILADTPNSVLDPSDSLQSILPFTSTVKDAIRSQCADAQVRLLAIAIYPRRHSYFVLDVNNASYDYGTAHHDTILVPVYVLRLSRRPVIFRKANLDGDLATRIADLHLLHGMDPLPFFDDHNQVLQYCNPRGLASSFAFGE